jgi:ABC-type Zn uptake system ZnuABC Zn-binding protein ZnuA
VRKVSLIIASLLFAGCGGTSKTESDKPVVVVTSSVASSFVESIAQDTVEIVLLVPNSVDTHTYEPKPSELRKLEGASLVVMPDENLNMSITQVVNLSVDKENVLDLNKVSLQDSDYFYRDTEGRTGRNVHTWTDPVLAAKWIKPLTEKLISVVPEHASLLESNAIEMKRDLEILSKDIESAMYLIDSDARKMVVYHDAWEYFGRRYNTDIIGSLQALNYAEPSAGEIADMAQEIKKEGVRAFFGSEVFPSDVMEALERESGAKYVPGLADDKLPGESGTPEHSYVSMMTYNLKLIAENLGGPV